MKTAPKPEADDPDAEWVAAVKQGIAEVKAGRAVPYEKVRPWLLSLGTDHELPMPECE